MSSIVVTVRVEYKGMDIALTGIGSSGNPRSAVLAAEELVERLGRQASGLVSSQFGDIREDEKFIAEKIPGFAS